MTRQPTLQFHLRFPGRYLRPCWYGRATVDNPGFQPLVSIFWPTWVGLGWFGWRVVKATMRQSGWPKFCIAPPRVWFISENSWTTNQQGAHPVSKDAMSRWKYWFHRSSGRDGRCPGVRAPEMFLWVSNGCWPYTLLYMNSDTCEKCVYCLDSEQPMILQPLLGNQQVFVCVCLNDPIQMVVSMCVYVCLTWSLHFVVGRIQINWADPSEQRRWSYLGMLNS